MSFSASIRGAATWIALPPFISNPYQPKEVAYYVPGAPAMSPKGSVQINDVYVDDRQLVYIGDRFTGGLYILEMNI